MFAIIGLVTICAIFAFGVYYIITNITFKKHEDPYTYEHKKDSNGTIVETVKDKRDGEE
jgi:Ca2+/H+ antiporter